MHANRTCVAGRRCDASVTQSYASNPHSSTLHERSQDYMDIADLHLLHPRSTEMDILHDNAFSRLQSVGRSDGHLHAIPAMTRLFLAERGS